MGHSATPDPKRLLRRQMRARRDGLDPRTRAALSRRICDRIRKHSSFASAAVVACYQPLGSEVDVAPLTDAALTDGKRVVLPRIEGPGAMTWREHCVGDALVLNALGIAEPRPNSRVVALCDVDVALVPGLAFDASGGRLGYGGGYYDRALQDGPDTPRIGVAFEAQIVEHVPRGAHDLRVHAVVTEARTITTS